MEYVHLGRAGVEVSRLCLGTMNFGPLTSEEEADRIMDRALEAGINFFDTANVYGRQVRMGLTEEIVGRWFAKGGGRREKVVIATKVYGSTSDWPNDTFLSARNIRSACEASLRRLQTDHLDLYQMHHIDRNTPWDEIWEAFETLRLQGKVLYFGSSNFAGWHIARAQEQAHRRHRLGLISEQSLYNLMSREVELEVLPACREYGVGVIPWSPLAGGILAGALEKRDQGRRSSPELERRVDERRASLEAYEAYCRDRGEDAANIALAWLLHQPGVVAPIIGPRTTDQLTSALRAPEIGLGREDRERLDQLFPGPGGHAPEAYAW